MIFMSFLGALHDVRLAHIKTLFKVLKVDGEHVQRRLKFAEIFPIVKKCLAISYLGEDFPNWLHTVWTSTYNSCQAVTENRFVVSAFTI